MPNCPLSVGRPTSALDVWAHPAEIGGVGQLSSNVHEAKYCNLHWVNVTGILDDPDEYNWNAKLLGIYIYKYILNICHLESCVRCPQPAVWLSDRQ